VAAAPKGTTIQVRGICLGPVAIGKNLTLVGKPSTLGGPGIYGQESVRVLEIAAGRTVTVKSLEIAYGWAGEASPTGVDNMSNDGGGILNLGTLTLTDVVVTENDATEGGGIANYGTLRIDGASEVHHNRATGLGGGIVSAGRLTIAGAAVIHSNTAGTFGGGVVAGRGTFPKPGLTIRDTAVVRDNTGEDGGGIAATVPVLLRDRAAVRTNTARSDGGGVYLVGGRLTLAGRASISSNVADRTGGIVSDASANRAATVILKGSSVVKRNVGRDVAGIHMETGRLTMLDESSVRGHRTLPSLAAVLIQKRGDLPASFTMKGLSRVTDNRVSEGWAAVVKVVCPGDPVLTFTGVKARTTGNTPKNVLTICP
jgi:hypothetical protein